MTVHAAAVPATPPILTDLHEAMLLLDRWPQMMSRDALSLAAAIFAYRIALQSSRSICSDLRLSIWDFFIPSRGLREALLLSDR